MAKLYYFFRFADGVDDEWYRTKRLESELAASGVNAVRSWRTIVSHLEPDPVVRPLNLYSRLTEVSFSGWETLVATLSQPSSPWSPSQRQGLTSFEAILVEDEPEYDLRRDMPGAQYKYVSMPIEWSQGRPPSVPDKGGVDMAKFMYFFTYKSEVDLEHAEDWYLGHHAREGKQLPGLMRYVTWKRLLLPTATEHFPEVGRFHRFTELCFDSIETWVKVCYQEGPKWLRSPRHGEAIWDNYKCFFVPGEPDIVLANEVQPKALVH